LFNFITYIYKILSPFATSTIANMPTRVPEIFLTSVFVLNNILCLYFYRYAWLCVVLSGYIIFNQ